MIDQIAQAATQATQVATQNTSAELGQYLGSAMSIAFAQRALKSRDFYQAFIKAVPGSDRWAHLLVAAAGCLAAMGLTYKFSYDIDTGGEIVVALPTLAAILHGIKDFGFIFGGQQWIYESTRTNPEPPSGQPPPPVVQGGTP